MNGSSSKSSMFDGLQIFGKTDAKFSMTSSMQGGQAANNSRAALNSNYEFDNSTSPPHATSSSSQDLASNTLSSHSGTSTSRSPSSRLLGPPGELMSLPATLHEPEEEVPPSVYPLEPSSLDTRQHVYHQRQQVQPVIVPGPQHSRPRQSQAPAMGLPRTWRTQSVRTDVQNEVPKQRSQDNLVPLQQVGFRQEAVSPVGNNSDPPPLGGSPEPGQEDPTGQVFTRAVSQIEAFQNDLRSARDKQSSEVDVHLRNMRLSDQSIRANALQSIQKLMSFETFMKESDSLSSQIAAAIEQNQYAEAEQLQEKYEESGKNLQQFRLLQFRPPRLQISTQEELQKLNSSRKSHMESSRNFCVVLDDLSSKFKSISKKIEVQCSSKIDKQKQGMRSEEEELGYRLNHSTIDEAYLEQRERSIEEEMRVSADDHQLQMHYQEELLQGVQVEIRILEEKLRGLRAHEKAIIGEKQKLLIEKVENEKVQNNKRAELKRERESCKIKKMSLERDKTELSKRKEHFESHSSKLECISGSQRDVETIITNLKAETCESLSDNERLIVSEVHVAVNTDIDTAVTVPETLSQIMDKIAVQESIIDTKSNSVFELSREISRLKSEEGVGRTNLGNCKALKTEAISKKRFQEAAKLSTQESQTDSQLTLLADEIHNAEMRKCSWEGELDCMGGKLVKLQGEASQIQAKFDRECLSSLLAHLTSTMSALSALPAGVNSISRALLEYDACYIFSFINMIRQRNKDVGSVSSVAERTEVERLMEKIEGEAKEFALVGARIKGDIDAAIAKEDYARAEELTAEYDLVAKVLVRD